MLDPRVLKTRPLWNVRIPTPALEEANVELKASIKANGVLEPLTVVVEGEDVIITNGHRRHAMVMELIAEGVEIVGVPARTEDKRANEEDQVLSMITRNSGLPLTPLEKGDVFRRLECYGWSEDRIAERAGTTVATVKRLLALSSAPRDLRGMVETGRVSATMAAKTIKEEGPDKAAKKLRKAAEETEGRVMPKNVKPLKKAPVVETEEEMRPIDLLNEVVDAAYHSQADLDAKVDEVKAWLEENGHRDPI
jgi:ParB-like chromosome segregation protein Spo0J